MCHPERRRETPKSKDLNLKPMNRFFDYTTYGAPLRMTLWKRDYEYT